MFTKLSEAPITRGTRVLLRANLNAPLDGDHLTDASRIFSALPTLEFLRARGACTIILAHASEKGASLRPAHRELTRHMPAVFVDDAFSASGRAALEGLQDGECALVENIRNNPGEERNTDAFAQELAKFADIFVQDDFSVAHRAHASVVGIPKYLPSFAGLRFAEEFENLSKAFAPEHPAILILGGAKSKTKLPIAASLADTMDSVFIAGISGNTMLRAQGRNTGQSAVDDVPHSVLKEVLSKKNVITYRDALVTDGDGDEYVVSADAVLDDNAIVDAGPETTAMIVDAVSRAAFVLWNGPLGFYEKGHTTATHEVARAIAKSKAYSIIGGGDTRSAISSLGLEDGVEFISTAGGAMLEFLAKKTLPGIDALSR